MQTVIKITTRQKNIQKINIYVKRKQNKNIKLIKNKNIKRRINEHTILSKKK